MPVYWVILSFTVFLSVAIIIVTNGHNWAFLQSYKNQSLGLFSWLYLCLTNLFIIGQDVSLFMGLNNLTGNLYFTSFYNHSNPPVYFFMLVLQAWTISIEIMFYLIAPFIVRKKITFIALFFFITAVLKYVLYSRGLNYDPWSYRFFPAEMFFFLLGVLSYKLYLATKNFSLPKWFLVCSFAVTLSAVILFEMLQLQFHKYIYFVCFALAIPLIFQLTKDIKWDRLIGEYSYPMYISHVFFKSLYFILFAASDNVSLPVLGASVLFTFLYNQFLYKKLENFRQRRVVTADLNNNKI